ncbi:MAG: M20/M25/M40 family metallo-hydrolase [Chitinophagaceae bacterium]
MTRTPAIILLLLIASSASCQKIDKIINRKDVERIERMLSSDEMQGRNTFTPGIDKAGDFIANEFKTAGLQPWKGNTSYKQPFEMIRTKLLGISGALNNKVLEQKNVMVITSLPELHVTKSSGFAIASIKTGQNLFREAIKLIQSNKNYLVTVDTSFVAGFSRLAGLKEQMFKPENSVVFILTAAVPEEFDITASHQVTTSKLANIVGILPGKSKPDEFVIFSSHYDHLGTGKPVDGDSIFNGANDDAAGSTAVISLARYFKAAGNNERSLVFATFTAEEIGGFGSQYFSKQFNADAVVAMFNIEMIGTDSKWGNNSAYITGYEKTNMGKIMEKNLKGTGFTFHPDPYTDQQLFYRSDNATLARLGVPAHTISTSKMDNEKFYHTVNDEIETLDMDNMARIIKAIALSSKSIVSGKDTPTRVDTNQLR